MLVTVKIIAARLLPAEIDPSCVYSAQREAELLARRDWPAVRTGSAEIAVVNSYRVKDALKQLGFRFSLLGREWWKPASRDTVLAELKALHALPDEIIADERILALVS